jgi:hypothetical protein
MELMPSLRSDFVKFSTYAEARLEDLVPFSEIDHTYGKAVEFRSGIVSGLNEQNLSFTPFPAEIQWSGIHAFAMSDLNGDGLQDIILGGNNFELEIESARTDALTLVVLIQQENGRWDFMPQSGLLNRFNRELRSIEPIQILGEPHLLIGWKEHPIEILKMTITTAQK